MFCEQYKKVNMEALIVQQAFENIDPHLNIQANWEENQTRDQGYDFEVDLTINDYLAHYWVEVKRQIRNHDLQKIVQTAQNYKRFMIVAEHLTPGTKEMFREQGIAYLEGNGNLFLQDAGVYILIDNKRPQTIKKELGNRAFTKTGVKVVFQLLNQPELINAPQRMIAEAAGVGLGNIPQVITGLKETGFLMQKDKNTYLINNKVELLNKWAAEYTNKLKPGLYIGNYKFQKTALKHDWRGIVFNDTNYFWGGEAAGDLLTDYLRPEILTLYTGGSRIDLMLKLNLIPDEEGDIKVYQKFWNRNPNTYLQTAPPIIVYADLIAMNDKRCLETAQKIFDEYIQPNL